MRGGGSQFVYYESMKRKLKTIARGPGPKKELNPSLTSTSPWRAFWRVRRKPVVLRYHKECLPFPTTPCHLEVERDLEERKERFSTF
jgi:hypothetical protein